MKDEIKEITKQMQKLEAEARTELEGQENALTIVEYDVRGSEERDAFIAFQKRYVYKQNIIKTVAFALVAVLFMIRLIFDPTNVLYWVCLAVCLAAIAVFWYNPVRIRRTIMDSIKPLADDRYVLKLYEDKLTIETILPEDDRLDDEGNEIKIKPTEISFRDIGLKVLEKHAMFVLFLRKESIYVLPKRCMEEYQVNIIKSTLSEQLGEDYEVELASR